MINSNIKSVIGFFFVGVFFFSTVVTIEKTGIAFAQSSGHPLALAPPKALVAPEKIEVPKVLETPPGSVTSSQAPAPVHKPILPHLGPAQRILPENLSDSVFQLRVERKNLRGVSVEVNTLKSIDPDAVGVLESEQGGFGENMWAGMARKTVDRLLPHLPVNTLSWAMRDLMRRLLLSIASVPEGDGNGSSLVALRISLLKAMGDLSGVNDLLTVTSSRDNFVALARLEADFRLLSNDNARACQLTAKQMGKSDDSYWQKVFVFCQALAGERGRASLGADLLREADDTDKIFFLLFDGLISSSPVTIESLSRPTPLQLAMARVVKANLPADVISSNELSILRIIATSPNAALSLRLEAAERAEAAGALSMDTLRQLYTSVSFSEEELANPLSKAEAGSGPLSRALLYRTALVQTVPAAQAEVVAKTLSLARKGGGYASAVRVVLPVLKRIPATEDLIWFAPEAARAFLISREPDAAKAWFNLMRANAVNNKETEEKLAGLLPIARIAGSNEADFWAPEVLKIWRETVVNDEKENEKAVLLYYLLDIFGDPIPEEDWEKLIISAQRSTVAMPRPEIWYRLATAAGQQQIGATVVLSLLALGEGGPAGADPIVLRQVLSGLRTAGLEIEARSMALEAALAAGL